MVIVCLFAKIALLSQPTFIASWIDTEDWYSAANEQNFNIFAYSKSLSFTDVSQNNFLASPFTGYLNQKGQLPLYLTTLFPKKQFFPKPVICSPTGIFMCLRL
ncbi:MAG: hypothetical protein WC951_08745 [Bacteroidales bacterium]|nr:hypothetical protein [Tenuifilaceae bacterium]